MKKYIQENEGAPKCTAPGQERKSVKSDIGEGGGGARKMRGDGGQELF